MAENFQDNVSYGGSTLAVSGDAIAVGSTNAGAKSIIFNNTGSQGHLAWQPTNNRTINLPDVNGTIQLTGQAPGGMAAGTQTGTTGTIVFSNGNGISFGMSNSSIVTASYTVPSTAGLISSINVSAGTTSNNLTNFVFSNSNNVSFGLNGSTITVTATFAQTAQTQSNIQAIYDGANSISTGTIRYSNSNGISFGINGQTLTASVSAQTVGLYALGNTTQNSSTTLDARTLSFNGLGIITAGYSNGSIQISATQSNQAVGLYAVSNTTGASSSSTVDARSISFQGAGIASVGYTNGSVVISVPSGGGVGDGVNILAAGTQTANTTGTVLFSNSNGISFGMSNSSIITASYTVPTQTVQTVGLYGLGNTTQNSSTTLDARSLSFNGLGAVSVGYSNGSVQLSAPVMSNISVTGILSASLNGSTLSLGVPSQTIGFFAASNTTQNSSSTIDIRSVTIQGAGGVSVGYSNGSVVISGGAGGGGSLGFYATGNTTQNSSTTLSAASLSFNALGAMTMGYSNGSIQVSAPPSSSLSATGILSISTNGSTISIGVANQTVGFYGLGNTTQNSSTTLDLRTLSFNGLGMITVGYSNGSIQLSATQTNQTGGRYALGNTTGQSSSSTFDMRTLSISGAGNISLGYSGNALVISGAGGGAAISAGTNSTSTGTVIFSNSNGISFGMSNNGIITASVVAVAGSDVVFSNSNNIVFGKNVSTVTASAVLPIVYSYEPFPLNNSNSTLLSGNNGSSGSASFIPFSLNAYVAAGWINMIQSMNFITSTSNSNGSQSLTLSYGIYTRGTGTNSTTLGSITSGSYSFGVSYNSQTITINQPTTSNNTGYATGSTTSAGVNITSGYSGAKLIQFPINSTMSPGQYWLGLFQRVSTSSVSIGIQQSFVGFALSTAIVGGLAPVGSFSSAFTGTNLPNGIGGPWHLGIGNYSSVAQTNLPVSVALSAITGSAFSVIPYMKFVSNQT